MGTRNRVISFMSNFSNRDSQRSPTPTPTTPTQPKHDAFRYDPPRQDGARDPATPTSAVPPHPYNIGNESPQPRVQRERVVSSRPMSMVQTYQPPLMDLSQDTLPELQPIFTFLNSHANKLYQEGYFLKLDDQNTHGRPNADRTWTECFAQLVGTVLSLWDAAELDAAGQDGEVLPKFINLTDASIKMIESLPTRSDDEAPLQNVLSISTAGKNRYLLHFNSHHSLIQWTAGIRLAMYEHCTLQEAYTGALIAGKGKALNNINTIMERAKIPTADWARVRFGAGTPWRRCWCVIAPPDEKEVQRLQKQMNKKKSAYDRSKPLLLKGDIKFYDTKRTKKIRPIATITDAYSAFAIYPQSKPLIDASTLVKVEGSITIHSNPPSTTEGFVFVMPEVHPAVTGFEMMLRWLFPVFDTFGLYGRPGRLIADTKDVNSLMFAMPKHRRYGYLEILDVSGLILEQGSGSWRESEWRKKMKDLTAKRMTAIENGSQRNSRYSSRRSNRNSFGPSRSRIQFDDSASVKSSPSITWGPQGAAAEATTASGELRTDSAPPAAPFAPPHRSNSNPHRRSVSETHGAGRFQNQAQESQYDGAYEQAPTPPPHGIGAPAAREGSNLRFLKDMGSTPERVSSEDEARTTPIRELQEMQKTTTPEPVAAPPAFSHAPGSKPASKPYHSPELRRANSRMSNATLSQLAGATGVVAAYQAEEAGHGLGLNQHYDNNDRYAEDGGLREFPAKYSFDQSPPARQPNFNTEATYSKPPAQFPFSSAQSIPIDSQGGQNRVELPVIQGHVSHPSTDSTFSTSAQQPHRLQTGQSVVRKPLPARQSSIQTPTSAETVSSGGSLGPNIIDQAAFDMIGQDNRKLTPMPESQIHRQNSGISSVYDDNESVISPDYASTRRSVDTTRPSVEKPRTGVMRTVGNVAGVDEYEAYRPEGPPVHIDFGPTFNYASDNLPLRTQGQGAPQSYAERVARQPVPAASNYPSDRVGRRASPGRRPSSSGHAKTPSQGTGHYRNNSAESRTLAWQPGMGAIGNAATNQQAVTPEQFVQHRAAVTPLYAHQRQASGNTLRGSSATPPLVRNRSSDYLGQGHSRNNSAELLQRPGSRGAAAAYGPSGTGDITSNLSAREQEHLARATGQPLITVGQNNNRPSTGSGLVGAIEAREKEKQQMKQGINSQAVQHAIAQRQQVQYQQYPDPVAGQYRAPQSQMGQYPQQYPGAQAWTPPAANAFAQGGGFGAASPAYADQGGQSPSQYAPRQQYPPPQQQQQGGQGRGNQGYRGQ